jgi:Domain of unknown function (DUF4124)
MLFPLSKCHSVTRFFIPHLGWLLAMAIMVSASFAGEVYKWTDADGRVHFGDKPGGAQSESVQIKSSPVAPQTAGPALEAERRERTARLLNEYAVERSEREVAKAKAQAALTERRQACTAARRELAELEQTPYLYTRDEKGAKVILPASDLRKERALVTTRVQELCKGDAIAPNPR